MNDNQHHYDHISHGIDNQTLEIRLMPGQSIHAENGAMSFMEDGIAMSTGAGKGRGPLDIFKRKMAGESILLSIFTNESQTPRRLGLSPLRPAYIMPIELGAGQPDIICQPGGFLAGHPDVRITAALGSTKAAFFGKGQLIMQRLHGIGQAFLAGNGAIIQKRLDQNDTYLVQAEALVGFEDTVTYSTKIPSGLSNVLWSRERLFLLALEGPGTAWFHSTSKHAPPQAKNPAAKK